MLQATTAVFTAALTLFLVRALSPEGFGLFSLALAIGTVLLLPSDLGLSTAAARFIAEHRGDTAGVARVLADALRLKLVVAAAVSLVLFAAAGPIADVYAEPGLAWPIRGMALALFGHSLLLLIGGAFVAQARVATAFRITLSESVVETGATVALVLLGTGVTGAAFGRAIGYVFGAAVGLALLARALGGRRLVAGGGGHRRQIAGYAGALVVVEVAYTALDQLNALLIGAFRSATDVGVFQAPLRLITLFGYLGLAVANGVAPRLARRGSLPPDPTAFVTAVRLVTIVQAAALAPLIVWAEPIVHVVLGSEYDASADVLRALAAYAFLLGVSPLFALAANYVGEARRRVPVAIAALVANAAVALTLIPVIGVVGGAAALTLAFAIYVPGHVLILRRALDLPLRPIVAVFARSLLAAGAMAATLWLVGTQLSPARAALGAAAGLAVYAAVLVGSREISLREIRDAARAIRSRFGAAPRGG